MMINTCLFMISALPLSWLLKGLALTWSDCILKSTILVWTLSWHNTQSYSIVAFLKSTAAIDVVGGEMLFICDSFSLLSCRFKGLNQWLLVKSWMTFRLSLLSVTDAKSGCWQEKDYHKEKRTVFWRWMLPALYTTSDCGIDDSGYPPLTLNPHTIQFPFR